MSAEGDGAGDGPFSARAVAAVIAVGLFAFSAFFVLSAWAPELRQGRNGGAHALSNSAVGFAGVRRLLELQGVEVAVSRREASETAASLWIATPPVAGAPGPRLGGAKDREALDAFVNLRAEPVLVVLPKWRVSEHERRPDWVRKQSLMDDRRVAEPMRIFEGVRARVERRAGEAAVDLSGLDEPRLAAGPIDHLQVLQGAGFEPVVTDADGGTVLAYVAGRNTYILSDPDLLNTQGLAELDTARAASALVRRMRAGAGPVVFDVSLHGFASGRSLLKLAFSPPFLAATLCAAAAAGLAGWQAAVRFGPRVRPRPTLALGAEALTDNAAMLIRLSGREHRMAARYAELTETAVLRAVRPLTGVRAPDHLDRLGRRRPGGAPWSALRREAEAVRTREALLAVARRMHVWRREVAGGS